MRLYWQWLSILLSFGALVEAKTNDNDIRLPESIVPNHYDIAIMPDLQTGEVEGIVRMEFSVKTATDKIVMHGVNITVVERSVKVSSIGSGPKETAAKKHVPVSSVSYDPAKDFIIIRLGSQLDPDRRFQVTLNYIGALSNNLKGLYRSDYFDHKARSKK